MASTDVPSPYGKGEPIDEETVLAGMSSLSDELTKEFDQRKDQFSKHNLKQRKFTEKLINQTGIDIREFIEASSHEELSRRERLKNLQPLPPQSVKVSPSSFNGSLHVTRTPPYEYQWTWSARWGNAGINTLTADKGNGRLVNVTYANDECALSSRAAVGVFFRPISRNGQLIISASPSLHVLGWADSDFGSGQIDGWIGLYVRAYNMDRSSAGAVLRQQNYLYSEHVSWLDSFETDFATTGYPISAMIPVDDSHMYTVWVWTGTFVSSGGKGLLYWCIVNSAHHHDVPSISLSYFG
jgi:hypothetical protein